MKQVAKQEAVLAFENADLEQDEAVMTSAFMADHTIGKPERVVEVQRMSQQAANEAWISDSGASTHTTFSSTGMTNYRKCEKRLIARVAGGRSLKVLGFGDVAVVFRSGESIIPVEAMQCGTCTRDLLQPAFAYRPFETGSRIHWRLRGDCTVVSLQQSKRSMLFEKCGNLYQIYWSSPNCAGSFFTVVNDANDSYRYDKSHVVTRRVDKQDVTIGGLPDKTRQATRTGRGRQRAGWRIAGKTRDTSRLQV